MALEPDLIDSDAEKVVRRLARRGHKAYLVGGCVRDLLLDRKPKDFDVATSATPNEIKQLFRNCRIIGRRFRLAHIFFGSKIIETSTFRANPRERQAAAGDKPDDVELLIRRDNVFGSEAEDAQRRDFTINGLFYDLDTEEVIDHVGGLADLEERVVRTIGQPDIRFQEDPVRMLRAIKFAARLDFEIEAETLQALIQCSGDISKCAAPRVLEEVYRFLREGAARRSMVSLLRTGVADVLSPQLSVLLGDGNPTPPVSPATTQTKTKRELDEEEEAWRATWSDAPVRSGTTPLSFIKDPAEFERRRAMVWRVIDELDRRSQSEHDLSNALGLASLIGPFVIESMMQPGVRPLEASNMILEILEPLARELRVARRDAERVRQILLAQRRLAPSRRRRGRPMALVRRDYFDEALALYEIMAIVDGRDTKDIDHWRKLSTEGNRDRQHPADDSGSSRKRRRRRRGGRRRRRDSEVSNDANAAPGG